MKSVLIVSMCALLSGCNATQRFNVVSPPKVLAQSLPCAPGVSLERDQYVALMSMPCAMGKMVIMQQLEPSGNDQLVQVTLTRPLGLQAVRLWQGTYFETQMELGMSVDFDTPDGHHLTLIREYDKHSIGGPGNYDDWRLLSLSLPAGTVVTMRRAAFAPINCGTLGCVTQEMVQLYGRF